MVLKAFKKHLIIISALVTVLIVLSLLKTNAYISEYVFTRGISRVYINGVGAFTSLLPFSLYEVLLTAAIIYTITLIVLLIKNLIKKNFKKALKMVMTFASVLLSIVILYNLTASFAYNRLPLDLSLNEENPDNQTVLAAAEYFLNDYNSIAESMERDDSGNIIPPYNFNELSKKLQKEYAKYENTDYLGSAARAKPMFYSEIMSYMGFSGVFMAITAEPNVNVNIPPKQLPVVCAHEMAHSAGLMKENEANLMAYYVLLNSDDPYLRYSGYGATFNQILSAVQYTSGGQDYDRLIDEISPLIKQENANSFDYWNKYRSFIQNITNTINDLYLKLSGIKEGTSSYQNPYEIIDTGEVDEQTGDIIYEIYYSKVQFMYFTIYQNKTV